jgi:predicted transcriptional regulator
MHDEANPSQGYWDSIVLQLLTDPELQQPASIEEIAREIGSRTEAEDSLERLQRAGLVHRLDNFVWATRATLHMKGLGV